MFYGEESTWLPTTFSGDDGFVDVLLVQTALLPLRRHSVALIAVNARDIRKTLTGTWPKNHAVWSFQAAYYDFFHQRLQIYLWLQFQCLLRMNA